MCIFQVDFTAFAVSGDLLWDYEYFLRRGLGRVRVEPIRGQKVRCLPSCWPVVKTLKTFCIKTPAFQLDNFFQVDIYVTSLASMDYNYWYREHQAAQLVPLLAKWEWSRKTEWNWLFLGRMQITLCLLGTSMLIREMGRYRSDKINFWAL